MRQFFDEVGPHEYSCRSAHCVKETQHSTEKIESEMTGLGGVGPSSLTACCWNRKGEGRKGWGDGRGLKREGGGVGA